MSERFTYTNNKGKFSPPYLEIIGFKVADKCISIFLTKRRKDCFTETLESLKERISENQDFYQTDQSYLINMEHYCGFLKKDGGMAKMTDDLEFPVSRRRKTAFLEYVEQQKD